MAGRSAAAVSDWLAAKPERWLAGIATAVIDPYAGYARGLAEGLPRARLVVDHFHAVSLANQALDEVRRRTQQATLDHRGWRGDPSTASAGACLPPTTGSVLAPTSGWWCCSRPATPPVRSPPTTLPRSCFATCTPPPTSATPPNALAVFQDHCRRAEVCELDRLARTVRRWQPQMLAWHATALANGPTEAVNLLIKKIKRVGHGFRNFENTAYVSCSTAASNGRLDPPHQCEPVTHG